MEMNVAWKSHYDSPLGGITGYAGGLKIEIRLLQLEGALKRTYVNRESRNRLPSGMSSCGMRAGRR